MKIIKVSLTLTFILVFGLSISVYAQKEKGSSNTIPKSGVILIPIRIVTAVKGETIEEFSERFGVFVEEVKKMNRIYYSPKILFEGEKLSIPAKSSYRIVNAELNDTVKTLACRNNVSVDDILKLNKSKQYALYRSEGMLQPPKPLTAKSLLVFQQKVKIPLEDNSKCIIQTTA